MTIRDFYEAVKEGNVTDEMVTYAEEAIAKLDETNAKRRAAAEAKKAEREAEKAPIREKVFAAISDEPQTATQLIEASGVEIKPQAIPALLKPFVEEGKIEKVEVKVTGKGKQRGYILG